MQKWHVGQKVSNTFSSVPIFKHQTFFLQELYQNERIQQIPVDLDILGHSVPSYSTGNHFNFVLMHKTFVISTKNWLKKL